jgi:hypothetical protein
MLRLTERDRSLIAKISVCRWLTTNHIRRLYFPGATVNAVQKRLRKLADAGLLRTHREDKMSEALHAVGPKGKAVVEERGLEAVSGIDIPRQIEHLSGVNDIRVGIETGAMRIAYFLAYWQLANLGWKYAVIPDAVFAVKAPLRRTFLVEYDRGTEPYEVLLKKFRFYEELTEISFEAVVIVMEESRRVDLLARKVRKENLLLRLLLGNIAEIREAGFFDAVFLDAAVGQSRKLLDPPESSEEAEL